ncbi:MAG: hypothetical protein HYT13_00500 [Candidatus Liptonbacteria bacterium]|nr:hypothetical protein [Candidatus Liptonbacteria bacterium]
MRFEKSFLVLASYNEAARQGLRELLRYLQRARLITRLKYCGVKVSRRKYRDPFQDPFYAFVDCVVQFFYSGGKRIEITVRTDEGYDPKRLTVRWFPQSAKVFLGQGQPAIKLLMTENSGWKLI